MSNGWPAFVSHWVQEFFKRCEIKVSNILSSHTWPICFLNSCSGLLLLLLLFDWLVHFFVFLFCFVFLFGSLKLILGAGMSKKLLHIHMSTYIHSLVCQWSGMGSISITGTGAEIYGDDPEDWEERNKVNFSGTEHMHFFKPKLRISTGNQKGAKLGCADRLQSLGCY